MSDRRPHVVVVGAGISGLAAAHALVTSPLPPIDLTVLEAAERAGGKLRTVELDGMPVEAGADSFVVRKPWALDLCEELGLSDQVVIPGSWGAFVWTRGKLVAYPDRSPFGIPSDVGDLLRWQGLPRGAKIRASLDLVRPARRGEADEPLGALVRRRLGARAARVLVEPLLAGLHAGDPLRLSVLATFPELRDWEQKHGSLLRGAKAAVGAAGEDRGHKPIFATLWGGLSTLVDGLSASIGRARVRLGQPARSIERSPNGLTVRTDNASLEADAVLLAVPAHAAAGLIATVNPSAQHELSRIPYASTAVVTLAYPAGTAARLPHGTGLVVPTGAATMTACTWVSRKWPRDEFGDRAVVRCFVGRAGDEESLARSDDDLVTEVAREVERMTPIGADTSAARVERWTASMPQYEVGHLDRVRRIEAALRETPGLFATGSAYDGVGIPDCIRHARAAAERILQHVYKHEPIGTGSNGQREVSWTS